VSYPSNEEKLQEMALGQPIVIILIQLIFQIMLITVLSTKSKRLSNKITKILKNGGPLGTRGDWTVYIVDFGDVANAFSFGVGLKHVYITKGLMKMLTNDEIIAVLLHEAAHSYQLHVLQKLATHFSLAKILTKVMKYVWRPSMSFGQYGLIMMTLVFSHYFLLKRVLGRWHENLADSFAVKAGYGKEMVSALRKLHKYMLKERKKSCKNKLCSLMWKLQDFMDEHPPFEKRVERVLEAVAKLKKKLSLSEIKSLVLKYF